MAAVDDVSQTTNDSAVAAIARLRRQQSALGRALARNGKAVLFGLVEVLTGYQHVLKGRIEGMQVSSMNGRVVSRCTHADGSHVTSIQMQNAVAGIAIVIMTKKAGPSAGSAKE